MVGIINDILNPVQVDEKIAPLSNSYQPDKINFGSDDTVEGRVAGIISSDSKLNTLARTGAAQTANSRGLLNTSMAIGEGEKAVIETATPIAAQDAQSSLAVKTANQNAQNQMLSQELAGNQNLNQIQKQGDVQSGLNEKNYGYETNMQILRGNQAKELTEIETNSSRLAQASNAVAIMSANYNAAIGDILSNSELTIDQKNAAIDIQLKQYRNQLAVLGKTTNLDLSAMLDFANMGGNGDPVASGAGNGGSVTGGKNNNAANFNDYVSMLLQEAGGQPSESLIAASLDEAVRRGESAGSIFGILAKLYPGSTYDQFVVEAQARGYAIENGKITKDGIAGPADTGTGTGTGTGAGAGGTVGDGGNAQYKKLVESFAKSTKLTLDSDPSEQGIIKVLNNANREGISAEDVYSNMSAYFPGISFSAFINELANRGYYDMAGAYI